MKCRLKAESSKSKAVRDAGLRVAGCELRGADYVVRDKAGRSFQNCSMIERSDFHKSSIFNLQSSILLMVAEFS